MKNSKSTFLFLLAAIALISSCKDDSNNDSGDSSTKGSIPLAAFDEFNLDAVTVSFDGDEITIESNGLPNHTFPYWEETNPLYIEPVVAVALTPGRKKCCGL